MNSFHDSTHLSGSHTNSCSCFFSHIIGFFTLEDFDFQALILNIFYRVVLLSLKWKNKQKRNKNCVLLPLMNCPLMPYISHCWKYIKHYNTTAKLHCSNSVHFYHRKKTAYCFFFYWSRGIRIQTICTFLTEITPILCTKYWYLCFQLGCQMHDIN